LDELSISNDESEEIMLAQRLSYNLFHNQFLEIDDSPPEKIRKRPVQLFPSDEV